MPNAKFPNPPQLVRNVAVCCHSTGPCCEGTAVLPSVMTLQCADSLFSPYMQVSSESINSAQPLIAGSSSTGTTQSCSQRRPRDPDEGQHESIHTIHALDSLINVVTHSCSCNTHLKTRRLSFLADSSDGLPRSACKRPKLDVTLEEWDLSGLPWWFLGNLRSNYTRRSNGSTDIHTNQVRAQNIFHAVLYFY